MFDVKRAISRLGHNVVNGIWRFGSMTRFFGLVVASSGTSFSRFRLVMASDRSVRDCDVVWIQDNRIGVSFRS